MSAGYIAIEGPIGVGKTTLAHALARELGARLVLEDIGGNPFLPRFYADPDSQAFLAQLYFLLTRRSRNCSRSGPWPITCSPRTASLPPLT